jgi:hypothetical protein
VTTRRTRAEKAPPSRRRPATTPEGQESHMVAIAVQLAEKQILEGTASAQVISHYLKLGSSREKLEQERLARENELLVAKVEQLASMGRIEELYSDAIRAMNAYSGRDPAPNELNDDDD